MPSTPQRVSGTAGAAAVTRVAPAASRTTAMGVPAVIPTGTRAVRGDSVPLTADSAARMANGAPSRTRATTLAGLGDDSAPSVRTSSSCSVNGAPGLSCSCTSPSAPSPANTPSGKDVKALPDKSSAVRPERPDRSSTCNAPRALFARSSSVGTAKSVADTASHGSDLRSALRTCLVRSHTPSSMVTRSVAMPKPKSCNWARVACRVTVKLSRGGSMSVSSPIAIPMCASVAPVTIVTSPSTPS